LQFIAGDKERSHRILEAGFPEEGRQRLFDRGIRIAGVYKPVRAAKAI
jgi:hypothetical protein